MTEDERFMREAIALARTVQEASPNPRVGAVVVRDHRVIGRGAHRGAGTAHAETVALGGIDATGATLYVTLEPCSFSGRTPPCAPAVVAAGIARVVAGMEDPDGRVRGRGFATLTEAGVEVTVGVLEDVARRINIPFIHQRSTGLPFLVLKLALTLDGRLAARDGSSRWITSPETRVLVHEERARSDAILVGSGTVITDNPSLSVRHVDAVRQPIRVVVDARGRVPASAALFASTDDDPVIVATTDSSSHDVQTSWKEAGAEVLVLERSDEGVDLRHLLRVLGSRDLLQVYCEGGAALATSLMKQDLVDRLHLHYGPKIVGGDGPSIANLGVETMADAMGWTTTEVARVGGDLLVTLERGS
ncbi:MAG TPA: bifunctional diaminohydroxyphosphoribosylaminopyrimidine deaminase/5-amino-6-(5-phosphoribosylamino)uracil reductase RibD [Actinomycetota bacterium]|nr:bifunctional diaminohydroxyphosphoribosylaminopyrimidine deaminase/5-amino-6-(5-phosphoribosylamino)uracil reductase RibD [Actinomycetota bacterium]